MEEYYLPISAIQHYAYCPRQCALIHVEQAWSENVWTTEGKILHERIDGGEAESRNKLRTERSVAVISNRLRISGKLDLLEISTSTPYGYFPVEYKRGKPKVSDWDKMQLCAQAMCLEEMRSIRVSEGALWYWQVRRREVVVIDNILRSKTEKVISEAQLMIQSRVTPRAVYDKRCNACSLIHLCNPKVLQRDGSELYIKELFSL